MKAILVGQYDRVLGKISTNRRGEWQLTPQDGTEDELREVLGIIYRRVQKRQPDLTPSKFVASFYAKKGAPKEADFTSAWAKPWLSPSLEASVASRADLLPYVAELERIQHTRRQSRKRA
jgi:hypothetical protein